MQSINFEFIRPFRPELANLGSYAEALLHIDPGSALTRLRALAEALTRAIHQAERLPFMPGASFFDLVRHPAFVACVDRALIHQINFLRVNGNDAAHGGDGDIRTAAQALGIAHQLVSYMGIRYYGLGRKDILAFQDVPDPSSKLKELEQSVEQYRAALDSKAEEVDRLLDELEQQRAKAPVAVPTEAQQAEARRKSHEVADALQWNEAETRRLMIDTMLAQAGWKLNDASQVTLEHPVEHQVTGTGTGYADYVLWDESGKPLAVVEAKRSSEESLQKGREQARMYADGLEKMTGQRPVIFYSNGYQTFIWDDLQYNSYHPVYGFYSRDSLEYLLYQREYRKPDLEQHNPNVGIAGRPYQIEAVKAVASRFQQQRRKALLVQATGTGKTRVAIAISELLARTGWAKRVLFLCDRKELRRQADEAFKAYLPSEPRCVIGERNKIDTEARIYVATYPGMMNRFQQLDVGFFDLIIADESHRSIYNKYRDLFDYFDALQIGLTATPVKFIARNTYDLFDCEDQDPSFNFSLDDAIKNDPPYLVPFRVKDLTTEFLRDGIHYADLSEEQKRQLEEDLGEEKAETTSIAGRDIGKKIFSVETDRIILENLMQNGIKDATGSLVGKTIVFAQNQKHAEHLESLFAKLYPQYGTRVCKVIHNKVPRADALIDEFKQADNDFRIAISVDMLDTGVDIPEVVNLVFAKPVRSWVKFWQMIGRGTRLRENLFGPGKHKTEFLIFDHYSNFTYFNEEYQEADEQQGKSLLQHLFEARLQLAQAALKHNHRDAFDLAVKLLREDINDLPEQSIAVRRELRTIHELQQTDAIERMDADTQNRLAHTLAPLMGNRVLRDKDAIAFDRLVADLEVCFVDQASCFDDLKQLLLDEINKLAINIQAVRQKDAVIDKVRSAAFWQDVTIGDIEWARSELRGIMKYRQRAGVGASGIDTTRAKDGGVRTVENPVSPVPKAEALQYRRRLKSILDDMIATNPVLQKIHRNEPVRPEELDQLTSTILTHHPGVDLGVLNEFYGRTATGLQATIRELIGMDPGAVEAHFTQFLHAHPKLTHRQVQFLNLLKGYIGENGSITIDKLYEQPFTTISHEGLDGVFTEADIDDLLEVLRPFVRQESSHAG